LPRQARLRPLWLNLAFLSSCLIASSAFANSIDISVAPIKGFDTRDTSATTFGKLEFLGAYVLSSNNEDFGGLSGIEFHRDNERFVAITDKARFITGRMQRRNGKISAFVDTSLTRVRNSNGNIITGAEDKDAEAITIHNDNVVLGYERNDRIVFFRERGNELYQDKSRPEINFNPLGFPFNKGAEAISFLPGTNELFIFPEHALNEAGNHRAFVMRNGNIVEFAVRIEDGFSITDAAFLPDGDLILLERYYSIFTGPAFRLKRYGDISKVDKDTVLAGELLLDADASYEIDNMEGLAAMKLNDGSIRLTLVSDDNFSKDQRTLLLEFKLTD